MGRSLFLTVTLITVLAFPSVSRAQVGTLPAVGEVTYKAAALSGKGDYDGAVALRSAFKQPASGTN